MSRPEWLAARTDAAYLEGLLAVAWANGSFSPEEYATLEVLLDAAGVTAGTAERVSWYTTRPDPVAVAAGVTDPTMRSFLLDRAMTLAWADGAPGPGEDALIATWAEHWGYSAEQLAVLRERALARLG
jgi:tellurite resistance protein